MLELAKQFINKECIIYLLSGQTVGFIKEVTDGGLLIEYKNESEIINIDFVMRIKEYPRKKNGKKKSIIV